MSKSTILPVSRIFVRSSEPRMTILHSLSENYLGSYTTIIIFVTLGINMLFLLIDFHLLEIKGHVWYFTLTFTNVKHIFFHWEHFQKDFFDFFSPGNIPACDYLTKKKVRRKATCRWKDLFLVKYLRYSLALEYTQVYMNYFLFGMSDQIRT